MKKKGSPERADDDLRRNYGAELFRNMKPNRFAGVTIAPPIYLDEDVAEVFDSSEAVNSVLRSVIKSMRTAAPKRSTPKGQPRKRQPS